MRAGRVSAALAVVGAVLLLSGTFGASSAAVDRSLSMSVVDDEDAFVSVVGTGESLTVGERETLFRLRNQFREPVAVDAVAVDHPAVRVERVVDGNVLVSDGESRRESLDPGERATVEVTCTEPVTETSVDVTVSGGDDVAFEVSDRVAVDCGEPVTTAAPTSTPTPESGSGPTSTQTDGTSGDRSTVAAPTTTDHDGEPAQGNATSETGD